MSIYDKKSVPQLIKILEKHFNAFIRMRDAKNGYFRCISCGHFRGLEHMHAGHYLAAGHYSFLRFNENNVHGQCVACNLHKHGNAIPYRINLVKKIGVEAVEELENFRHMSQKWDSLVLIEQIEHYKGLVKQAA